MNTVNDNKTPESLSKGGRIISAGSFANRLDLLVFAVYATKPFRYVEAQTFAAEGSYPTIGKYLRDLLELGLLEKTSKCKYQATRKAKQLFGANA